MARQTKHIKFMLHIFYLIAVSYLITRRSFKVFTVKKIIRFIQDIKHILIWTKLNGIHSDGQKHFADKRCRYINCYFTANRSMFGDTRYFDAIVFNLQDISDGYGDPPTKRGASQKFIFAANDSSDNYPVCNPVFDGFFNWTWSYKSNSVIINKFLTIHHIEGQELGTNIKWLQKMKPINSFIKNQLVSKTKAAAIFLDQCESRSQREVYVRNLQKELAVYNLSVDVFGDCGTMRCKRKTVTACYRRLRKDYFFYLAMENSLDSDYLTDIVLHGYKNHVVPIVYGGADYSKFLPPNSYLNAMRLSEEAMAKKIHTIMINQEEYHKFFSWINHYVISSAPVPDVCTLCAALNNPGLLKHKVSYSNFRNWWNPWYQSRCAEDAKFSIL